MSDSESNHWVFRFGSESSTGIELMRHVGFDKSGLIGWSTRVARLVMHFC